MPQADNGGVLINYDSFGNPADPTVLLVMGLTAQMTAWEDGFCQELVGHGYFVVRFDNRDCGLSSKTEGEPPNLMALLMQLQSGQEVTAEVPYNLSDMADDAVAVLDDLGIDSAHVVGASMGGMIVQTLAIEHPERVQSMTSIMSTTGDPTVGQSEPAAMAALITPPPTDRQGAIDRGVELFRTISGPLFDEARARERMTVAFDRSFHPAGGAFQMAAIATSGNRTERLAGVKAPTLVIHGAADPLVGLSGGQATAQAIPEADLLVFDDMGHDLPTSRWADITGAIAALASQV